MFPPEVLGVGCDGRRGERERMESTAKEEINDPVLTSRDMAPSTSDACGTPHTHTDTATESNKD